MELRKTFFSVQKKYNRETLHQFEGPEGNFQNIYILTKLIWKCSMLFFPLLKIVLQIVCDSIYFNVSTLLFSENTVSYTIRKDLYNYSYVILISNIDYT